MKRDVRTPSLFRDFQFRACTIRGCLGRDGRAYVAGADYLRALDYSQATVSWLAARSGLQPCRFSGSRASFVPVAGLGQVSIGESREGLARQFAGWCEEVLVPGLLERQAEHERLAPVRDAFRSVSRAGRVFNERREEK